MTNNVQSVTGLVRMIIIPHSHSHISPMIINLIQDEPLIISAFYFANIYIYFQTGNNMLT